MSFYRLAYHSDILGRDTDVLVAAPDAVRTGRRVVYLLHGGGGGGGADNTSWLPQQGRLEAWANQYNLVFIMPSSPDSFYANTHSGVRYQDYMLKELVPQMPGILNIPADRRHTAVAGMSMGGYSSLRLGLAAPELFSHICCLSAGNLWVSPLSNRVHAYALRPVFGVERIEDTQGTEHDLFVTAKRNIREGRPLPQIFHACGLQDHALEHAHPTAQWFCEHAPEYAYTYHEPEIGRHDDDFFKTWMPVFFQAFTTEEGSGCLSAET